MRSYFVLVLTLPLLMASGCAVRSGKPLNVADIDKIERGKTTKQEISERFGKPQNTALSSDSETWFYQFTDAGYATPIGMVGKTTHQESLTVEFKGEIVRDYKWSVNNSEGSKNPLGL